MRRPTIPARTRGRSNDGRAAVGARAERFVAWWLRLRGYRIVARNWRGRRGELDLVALRRGVLHIVEVRATRGTWLGRPAAAVTPQKQAQVRRVAEELVARNPWLADHRVVFSVAGVRWGRGVARWWPAVDWLPAAFGAEGPAPRFGRP